MSGNGCVSFHIGVGVAYGGRLIRLLKVNGNAQKKGCFCNSLDPTCANGVVSTPEAHPCVFDIISDHRGRNHDETSDHRRHCCGCYPAAQASFASAGCDEGEIVVKFAHVTNTDKHPKGIAASLLEQRVNEEMNGTMCMEVFPNSTLYNDNKVLEAMLQGDVQLAAPSLSKFEKFTKQFRLFDLPFMFKDINAVDTFQTGEAGQAMLDSMQRRGLQGLAFWHNGMKQMSANVPLIAPTDANG